MKRTLGLSINLIVVIVALIASIPAMASTDTGARISDSTVKVLVDRELARRGLSRNTFEVSIDDRIAKISGTVSTLAEKERIGQTVQKVYAVSGIQNDLAVAMMNDKDVAESVRKSIVSNPGFDAFDWIEASVRDGVVTISGSVREPIRKRDFENRLMLVAGVSKIENEIKVLPLSNYDDEIRLRVVRAIYGNSNFSRYALGANPPIHIIVENGRLVLKGIVGNAMDRQIAESIVRTSSLALDVRNELRVEAN
jgi:hyperosmotically inducible periplasmic protein